MKIKLPKKNGIHLKVKMSHIKKNSKILSATRWQVQHFNIANLRFLIVISYKKDYYLRIKEHFKDILKFFNQKQVSSFFLKSLFYLKVVLITFLNGYKISYKR